MKSTTTKKVSSLGEWMDAESESFKVLCGESFTHGEVVCVMCFCMSLIPAACLIVYIASWLAGGAA